MTANDRISEITRAAKFYAHLASVFGALYASEGWWASWHKSKRLHSKARAIVVFDRVLNGEEITS